MNDIDVPHPIGVIFFIHLLIEAFFFILIHFPIPLPRSPTILCHSRTGRPLKMSVYDTTRAPQYYGHNFNLYPNNFSNSNYNLYPSLPSLPSLTTVPYSAVRGIDADVDVEQTAQTLIPLRPHLLFNRSKQINN